MIIYDNSKIKLFDACRGYEKVQIPICGEEKICTVYIKNKGYCIYINGRKNEMFLIKANITPEEFQKKEHASEIEDFINIIKLLLDQIYKETDIPEYEEQHHEFVFLKIMDLFCKNNFELIDHDSDLHKKIELGFIKFEIDLLNHK